MILVIDFDYTLFDAKEFEKKLFNSLADLSISADLFQSTYTETVNRHPDRYDYDIYYQLKLISQARNIDIELAARKIKICIIGCREYLYSDSVSFLEKIRPIASRLILITHGNEEWQRRKVVGCQLEKYFDQIIFSLKSKVDIFSELFLTGEQEAVFLVNDKPTENTKIKNIFPVIKVIRIKRPGAKYIKLPGIADFAGSNLGEVYSYLINF